MTWYWWVLIGFYIWGYAVIWFENYYCRKMKWTPLQDDEVWVMWVIFILSPVMAPLMTLVEVCERVTKLKQGLIKFTRWIFYA